VLKRSKKDVQVVHKLIQRVQYNETLGNMGCIAVSVHVTGLYGLYELNVCVYFCLFLDIRRVSRRTHLGTCVIILKLNLISLKNIYIKRRLRWAPHTFYCIYVSQRSQIQSEDEDHAVYIGFRWVTTTCLRWEPQPVTLWLCPVVSGFQNVNCSIQFFSVSKFWKSVF